MEQVIEKVASGLGNGVGFMAESGILFVLFALVWIAFGIGLIWSQGSSTRPGRRFETYRWSYKA